ncbi:MAG: lipoprotein insertase outer membrane protein LolB [Candidatus Binatia bacterium]
MKRRSEAGNRVVALTPCRRNPSDAFRAKAAVLVSTVTLAIVCAGCAAVRRGGAPLPPSALPAAAQLEAVLTTRREAVRSLRALAQVHYRDPEESNSSREAIVVARPDRLRVEVMSLFGAVFVLTADDGALTAYARQENTVYRGQASPENLWRYVRLSLPVNELVDIVLGTPPVRQRQRAQVSFDAQAGAVRLWQDLAHGALIVWFSESELPMAAEERGADGQPEWHATFGEYEEQNGFPVATRIGLELPMWHRWLEMKLEDVDLNPALDGSVFALQTPPGSKVVTLDPVAD